MQPNVTPGRLFALDLARTAALAGMVAYHFTYDLALFGLIAPETPVTGGWLIFARSIATSFLFLVGVGLWLAHRRGVQWSKVWRRLLIVGGAAAAITLAAWATVALPVFDRPALLWVGLGTVRPFTVDYVPVFPWFGALLAGIAAAGLADRAGLWTWLARRRGGPVLRTLSWPGRYSLAIYLIHQPVLIGLIWAYLQISR